MKDKTWDKICFVFNSQALNVHRDVDSLRKQCVNMKHDAKKTAAVERVEVNKTGGGLNTFNPNDNNTNVLAIINSKSAFGLDNNDSDQLQIDAATVEVKNYSL